MRLPPAVVDLLTGHDVVLLAASARDGVPTPFPVAVPLTSPAADALSVLVDSAIVPRLRHDLEANPRLAISATRVPDCTSFQIKGTITAVGPPEPGDAEACARYLDALAALLWTWNPLARARRSRPRLAPDLRVTLAVSAVFVQTPGPDAGAPVV